MIGTDFPQRLRELRRKRNLSQNDLGQMIDLHYTHIGRYERGLSAPSTETLYKLANALGVTMDWLLEGETRKVAESKLEDKELLFLFQQVEQLPDDDKAVIKKLIDAFITKKKIQTLAK